MITEDYVSFETAKLLKEKGFDVECCSYYREANKNIKPSMSTGPANWNSNNFLLSCPTLQMAMKWLKEVHHIFIRVIQTQYSEYCTCEIYYNRASCYTFRISFDSYEDACEAAIKYCLENLI